MKIVFLLTFFTTFSLACDGARERMEAERAYQESQKQQEQAIKSVWQFKELGYDLEVSVSDDDVSKEPDTKELAQFTSNALRKIAGYPHLNIVQKGGQLGTVKVHYQVSYADYLSEDKQLKWKIPKALHATIEVDSKNQAGLWSGRHETVAASVGVKQLNEPLARTYALGQYRELIESSVSQLQKQLGKYPASD